MAGLRAFGIEENDRIVLLFPVSLELYTLIAAIYAIGGVAVLVDPGIPVTGLRRPVDRLLEARERLDEFISAEGVARHTEN